MGSYMLVGWYLAVSTLPAQQAGYSFLLWNTMLDGPSCRDLAKSYLTDFKKKIFIRYYEFSKTCKMMKKRDGVGIVIWTALIYELDLPTLHSHHRHTSMFIEGGPPREVLLIAMRNLTVCNILQAKNTRVSRQKESIRQASPAIL